MPFAIALQGPPTALKLILINVCWPVVHVYKSPVFIYTQLLIATRALAIATVNLQNES